MPPHDKYFEYSERIKDEPSLIILGGSSGGVSGQTGPDRFPELSGWVISLSVLAGRNNKKNK